MWTFITQLLVTLVSLGFFLVSCQNVMHIVKGSLCFVLKHIHQELDKELGESEGLSDDEETISTRVVRRRVFLKVTPGKRRVAGRTSGARGQSEGTLWWCMCGDAERIPTQVRRYDKDLRTGRPLWLHSVLGVIAACGTCSELPQYPAAGSGGSSALGLRRCALILCGEPTSDLKTPSGAAMSVAFPPDFSRGPSETCTITQYCCHRNDQAHKALVGSGSSLSQGS